jgi:hypothetical protein
MSLYEWTELKKTMPLFEDGGPDLRTMDKYKTFHCGNDKLTLNLVGIVSVFQNLRSTLLLSFHSVSSAYLPPPRGTLTGMFNAWVWSLAKSKQFLFF